MKAIHKLSLYVALMALGSCKGTSTGNPPQTDLAVTASANNAEVASHFLWDLFFQKAWALPVSDIFDSANNLIDLTESWVSLGSIRVELENSSSCDDTRLEGPYVVDLLSSDGVLVQDLKLNGAIDSLKWNLEPTSAEELPLGAPVDLENNSLLIKATVNTMVNFTFLSEENNRMEFASEAFSANGSNIVVNILMRELFSKIDLSEVANAEVISEASPHATLVSACPSIDNSAHDLYTCFRKGLERESLLGRDSDDDLVADN